MPEPLRTFLLPHRTKLLYRPRTSTRGDPYDWYLHVFYSKLDMDTSVCVRTVQRRQVLYSIRKYPVKTDGQFAHPIQSLLDLLSAWELPQRQVEHLLVPAQCFLDVHQRYFYTVSEDAHLTLEMMLGGLKQWPHGSKQGFFALCHHEIWSIMHQVLTGLEVLVSRGLQHENLSLGNLLITRCGVVKIAAIQHITKETPEGWAQMSEALERLARSLVQGSENPCSRCDLQYGEKAPGRGRCAGESKLEQVQSFRDVLNQSPLSVEAGRAGLIAQVKRIDFIHEAKVMRLGAIAELVAAKVFRDIAPDRPDLRTVSERDTSTIAPDTDNSLPTTNNINGR